MKSLKDFKDFKVSKLETMRGGKVISTILNGSTNDTLTSVGGDCILSTGDNVYACDSSCNHCTQ